MTADAGAPGAPRFDVVLRGYDRRQVDEHVARLQRALARMRADLDVARSQPFPVVPSPSAGFPAPGQQSPGAGPLGPGAGRQGPGGGPEGSQVGRPRPTPRPRPGLPTPSGETPDMIGSFTDRMQSILQAAEEEAAEIRNKARSAAQAQTDAARSEVTDLLRRRDAVLGELTRMRSQLEGLLSSPTARFTLPPRDDAGSSATAWDVAPGEAQPGSVQPGSVQPGSGPSASTRPWSVQPASVQPASVQPASVQPASVQPASVQPASAQPASAQPATGRPVTGQPESAQPATGRPVTGQPESARPATARPGPDHPGATPPPAGAPGRAGPASPEDASGSESGLGDSGRAGSASPPAGAVADQRPGSPSNGSAQAGIESVSGSPAASTTGSSAQEPASTESRGEGSGPAVTPGPDRTGLPSRPAAHRLPTGAYPAVAEKSASMRPRSEPDPEPGELFRPLSETAARSAVELHRPGDRDDRPAPQAPADGPDASGEPRTPASPAPSQAGGVEATVQVDAVRPTASDATVLTPVVQPSAVKRADQDETSADRSPEGDREPKGGNGAGAANRPASPSRSG